MKHLSKNQILLSNTFLISQKLDGCAFKVVKKDNIIRYYNRNIEITEIFRTITDMYEYAISVIENLPCVSNITYFEMDFEYFPTNIKPIIDIQKYPKNNLVLYKCINIPDEWLNFFDNLKLYICNIDNDKWTFLLENEPTIENIKKIIPTFTPLINDNEIEGIVINFWKQNETYKKVHSKYTQTIIDKKQEISKKHYIDSICNNKTDFLLSTEFNSYINWAFEVFNRNIELWTSIYSNDECLEFSQLNYSKIPQYLYDKLQTKNQREYFRFFLLNFEKLKIRSNKNITKENLLKINNVIKNRKVNETI